MNKHELTAIDNGGVAILQQFVKERNEGVFQILFDPLNNQWIKKWKDGHTIIIRKGR
jgi:hypothetical protein